MRQRLSDAERARLIEEVVKASRRPLPRIRAVVEVEGVDGKWYSPFGLPGQFEGTGGRRVVGFAFCDRNGTTFGRRGASEAEMVARFEAAEESNAAEFRAALNEMTDRNLRAQAEYWLKRAA